MRAALRPGRLSHVATAWWMRGTRQRGPVRACASGGRRMDGTHFDDWTRMLAAGTSRRRVLKGLLGGAGAGALSHLGLRRAGASHGRPPGATCLQNEHCASGLCDLQTRRCTCPGSTTARGGQCVSTACPAGTTLSGSTCQCVCPATGQPPCGTGATATCCAAGQDACLLNQSCAETCGAGHGCPAGCRCSYPSVEGPTHCIPHPLTCEQIPQACTSTAECPQGQHCQEVVCGDGLNRCVPLCTTV